jgi:hypothetical protein
MLGWDSMASIHVAKDLAMIQDPVVMESVVPAFNLKMSLAKVLGEDADGVKGIAIFTDREAVRFRAHPAVVEKVQAVIDAITKEGLVEG